jgi:hypothetical protein
MEHVVFIAKLPRSNTFLQGSSFCGRSVFICSAYVQRSSVSGTCMASPVPIFIKKWGILLREYLVKLFRRGNDIYDSAHRLYTSALRVLPMILPSKSHLEEGTRYVSSHTEMRNIVTIWKSGCNEDILFSVLRQSGKVGLSIRQTRATARKLTPIDQGLALIGASLLRP